jgi:putative restriction endonuclease
LGDPVVPNGLSLCKLHHAAFDGGLLGVSPDYVVHVRRDILEEPDGPMLEHGLKEIDRHSIWVPRPEDFRPDRERLDRRYERFRKAG